MARSFDENRRRSTVVRDNNVHNVYKEVIKELGEYAFLVPKSYIYEKIRKKTGLCTKTIAYIINHTEWMKNV